MKRQLNGLLSRWNIQFFYSGTYICIRQPLYSLVNYAKLKYSTSSAGLIQCLPYPCYRYPPPQKKKKKEKIKSYCIKYKESINIKFFVCKPFVLCSFFIISFFIYQSMFSLCISQTSCNGGLYAEKMIRTVYRFSAHNV